VRQESFSKALLIIDKLLALDPENRQDVRDRALVLLRLKRFVEARAQLTRFIEICPPGAGMQEEIREATRLLSWAGRVN
jgi:regulator of sirC expression with transglutaminase-like and TPR domain